MGQTTTLVLGLGNDLLSDDGFGPAVASACRPLLAFRDDVAVEVASVAGFKLLDLLAGYRRVLIVDVVQTGKHPPGTVLELAIDEASTARTLGGSHQMDLATALALGRALGQDLPESITLLVAEAKDLETVHEGLSAEVERAVDRAVAWVCRRIEGSPPGESFSSLGGAA
jgi:hydrogenase maturation protease